MSQKKSVFVIMSFDEEYDKVYHQAIKPAIRSCGFNCIRIDESPMPKVITSVIIRDIINADYIIADVSEPNANVFYELGISHSIGNKTITITKDISSLPFDISPQSMIIYTDENREGLRLLKSDLKNSLCALLNRKVDFPNNIVQEAGLDYFYQRKKIDVIISDMQKDREKVKSFSSFLQLKNEIQNNSDVAEEIVKHIDCNEHPTIICITGASGVGKSTFSKLSYDILIKKFPKNFNVSLLMTDAYMLTRAKKIEKNIKGYDPISHDLVRMLEDVKKLVLKNEEIKISPYDHSTGKHSEEIIIKPAQFLIIEGVQSFYPQLSSIANTIRYFIHGHRTQLKELKFIIDYKERGYSISAAFKHADSEYSSYEEFVLPYLKIADFIIEIDNYWKYHKPKSINRRFK